MPREELVIIRKGQELAGNPLQEEIPGTSWQVPASDGTGKEDIASEDLAIFMVDEADGAGAVPGDMEDIIGPTAPLKFVTLIDPARYLNGRKRAGRPKRCMISGFSNNA